MLQFARRIAVPSTLLVAAAACSAGGNSAGAGGAGQAGAGGSSMYDGGGDSSIGPDGSIKCIPGQLTCTGNAYYRCAEDGVGRLDEQQCADACDSVLGCVLCKPGSRRCQGAVSMQCNADATAWMHGRDCAEWSTTCGSNGYCADACGQAEVTQSYMGCEYWPVPLANTAELDSAIFDFRVVVANPGTTDANVVITRGAAQTYSGSVPAGGLKEIVLPWVDGQSFGVPMGTWNSIIKADGAYRLRSDQPVTVTQFNPFEYASDASGAQTFSYTNDASLLLPSHVLTGDYTNVTYVPFSRSTGTSGGPFPTAPDAAKYGGYVAIVGIDPEPTEVDVLVTAYTAQEGSGRFGYTPPFSTIHFTLQRGEVAHVAAAPPPDCVQGRPGWRREEDCQFNICDFLDTCYEYEYDLTGSRIHANRPVSVFGGHVCAYVPYYSQACDHLEAQLPPIQAWGKQFVTRPMTPDGGPGDNIIRVIAAFDNTQVTVDPPQGGTSTKTLNRNEWVEFVASSPFSVSGTNAIMVAQFLLGQYYSNPPASRGDPGMTVLPPQEQFRKDYIFTVPTSYNTGTNGQNYVLVVRSPNANITLDGQAVSATWQAAGSKEVGVVALEGGAHTMVSAEKFGLIAYGLGSFTSYEYPAGLNLDKITNVVK